MKRGFLPKRIGRIRLPVSRKVSGPVRTLLDGELTAFRGEAESIIRGLPRFISSHERTRLSTSIISTLKVAEEKGNDTRVFLRKQARNWAEDKRYTTAQKIAGLDHARLLVEDAPPMTTRIENRWTFPDGNTFNRPYVIFRLQGKDIGIMRITQFPPSKEQKEPIAGIRIQGEQVRGRRGMDPQKSKQLIGKHFGEAMMDHALRSCKPLLEAGFEIGFLPDETQDLAMQDVLQKKFCSDNRTTVLVNGNPVHAMHPIDVKKKKTRQALQ
ncbi:hypothetical protein CL622_07880 [archaeon]|nr:hypothetical protein [archaeon]